MRGRMLRLIAQRETRDLLRDRRTVMIIVGLPILLYPVFGLVAYLFALTMLDQKTVIGVVGLENAPVAREHPETVLGGGLMAAEQQRRLEVSPLVTSDGRFVPGLLSMESDLTTIVLIPLESDDRESLTSRRIDAMVVFPPNLISDIEAGLRPRIRIEDRDGDNISKLAGRRVGGILNRWQVRLRGVRFARMGLPDRFDEPVEVVDPQEARPLVDKTIDQVRDTLVSVIPFLMIMWTLAGALHPAVDLTAGEKERGTMETLLITPAYRSEIVAGKFLAVTFFAYLSALWNMMWIAGGSVLLGGILNLQILSLPGLAWCLLLSIPMAMVFSALCIALGVMAKSTKEGQYYLIPLFMVAMPLALWSLTPGLKLTLPLSLVPITGTSMIQQRLLSPASEPIPPECWAGVAVSLALSIFGSLALASWQFRREGVLFRDGDRMPLGVMVRRWIWRQ